MSRLSSPNLSILTNASSIVGTTAATSALGAIYWVVAARQFSPSAVGYAATVTSSMMLVGSFGTGGFGAQLMGDLPRHRTKARPLIATALVMTFVFSVFLGGIFAAVAPRLSESLAAISADTWSLTLFALAAGLTSVAAVLDQALIGLLRGGIQFARNLIFAVAKLVLLILAGWWVGQSGTAIFVTWVAGIVISLLALGLWQARAIRPLAAAVPSRSSLAMLWQGAPQHYALNLSLQVPVVTLPLIVTVVLSPEKAAYFYAAWMIVGLLFVGSRSLAAVLYAVGSQNPELLSQRLRFTLRTSLLGGIASTVVLLLGAELVMRVFGPAYADGASWSLRVLALGVFPLIVRDHFVTLSRIHGQMLRATRITAAGGVMELSLAVAGASQGDLTGLSLGWLVAVTLEACVMAKTVREVAAGTRLNTAG